MCAETQLSVLVRLLNQRAHQRLEARQRSIARVLKRSDEVRRMLRRVS